MLACSVPEATQAVATFLAKANGVLAGLAVADAVFQAVDPSLQVRRTGWGTRGALQQARLTW